MILRSILIILLMFKLDYPANVIAANTPDKTERRDFILACITNPLRYFCPNGAQERYINCVANSTQGSKIPIILTMFANGTGKTTATVNLLLNFVYGPQNGWFDYPVFRDFPFPKLIWYCSTSSNITDVVIPMIDEFAKKDLFPTKIYDKDKQGRTFVSKIVWPKQGWEMRLKTYDQDATQYESANVGIMVKDEPEPDPLWRASLSRMRSGCITLLPMTPLYCAPYIIDEIQKASEEGKRGYFKLDATVYDACQRRGIRGHLDPDIVDDMVDRYDQDEKEARVFGKPMYFSLTIYPELNRNTHFIPADKFIIPPYSKYMHVVDPHDSRPSASVYCAKTPDQFDRYVFTHETPIEKDRPYWDMKKGATIDAEVEMWDKLERENKIEISKRILDRHFGWQTRGKKTFAEMYQDAGNRLNPKRDFTFLSSYTAPADESEIAFGHKQISRMLKVYPDGYPGIIIHDSLYHTWNGLTHYIRRKLTGKTAEDKIAADAPIVEKYKDFPDIVRYAVCSDLTIHVPEKPKGYTQQLFDKYLKSGERNEFDY